MWVESRVNPSTAQLYIPTLSHLCFFFVLQSFISFVLSDFVFHCYITHFSISYSCTTRFISNCMVSSDLVDVFHLGLIEHYFQLLLFPFVTVQVLNCQIYLHLILSYATIQRGNSEEYRVLTYWRKPNAAYGSTAQHSLQDGPLFYNHINNIANHIKTIVSGILRTSQFYFTQT